MSIYTYISTMLGHYLQLSLLSMRTIEHQALLLISMEWLTIWRLCDKDQSKIDLVEKFFESLSQSRKEQFISIAKQYEDILNHNKYGPGDYRKRDIISLNAIKMAIRLKDDLDIFCFPFAEKCYVSAYKHDGVWCWAMRSLDFTGDIGSPVKLKDCLKKSVSLEAYNTSHYSIEIETKNRRTND